MKKHLLMHGTAFILLLFSVQGIYSQAFNLHWARQFSATTSVGSNTVSPFIVTHDKYGDIYIAGTFIGSIDFNPTANVEVHVSHSGTNDVFIAKMKATGDFIWAKTFGGTGIDYINCITNDPDGNILVGGFFSGTADLDPDSTATLQVSSSGGNDAFLIKLDSSGTMLFAKKFGGSGNDKINSIAMDNSGNILIGGAFESQLNFDPASGSAGLITSNGNADIFITKLSLDGNFIWVKSVGAVSVDESSMVLSDDNDNIYFSANCYNSIDMDPGPGIHLMTAPSGIGAAYLTKWDSAGSFIWSKAFFSQSVPSHCNILSVRKDNSGNFYLTGNFRGQIDFNPDSSISNYQNSFPNTEDIFILKLDSSGNYLWAQGMGANWDDTGFSFDIDSGGNIYLTGMFAGSVDFDVDSTTSFVLSPPSYSSFLLKLSPNGSFIWAKMLPGFSNGWYGKYLDIDAANNFYLIGTFSGTVDMDPGPGITNLTSPPSTGSGFVTEFNDSPTGIVEVDNTNELIIYPNPASNKIHVVNRKEMDYAILKIFSIEGKCIYQTELSDKENVFEISDIKGGVYFFQIENKKFKRITKLVIAN